MHRRRFLQLSAGGSLLLALPPASARSAAASAPNAYVELHADGRVQLTIPRSEMGQGVSTALAMLIAEELELPLQRVSVRTAEADAARFGDQGTGSSASVRTRYLEMRRAGAAVREMLRQAAAQRWGLSPADCRARDGRIEHPASGRSLDYAELLDALADRPVPADPPLKSPREFRLLGRPQPAVDLAARLRGRLRYGLDTRLPGMLHAAIARCPAFGGELAGADREAALAVPGVRDIVEIPPIGGDAATGPGLAVLAEDSWAAQRGRAALAARWRAPPDPEDDASLAARAAALLDAPPQDLLYRSGDPDAVLATAERVVSADYAAPWLAHATMEPMNCTAAVDGGRVTIWAPTQAPNFARAAAAKALNIDPARLRLRVTGIGGGFGRRLNADYVVEAAWLAQRLGGTVKVVWSREDDLQHDFYRPLSRHRLTAALDDAGEPLAWRHQLVSAAIFSAYELPPFSERPGLYEAIGALESPYRCASRDCGYSLLPSRVPRGWWRAVSATHTVFAVESFIDELAAAARVDPLAYRLRLIDELPATVPLREPDHPFEPARLRAVLSLAAGAAGWGRSLPAGSGRGIACSWDHLSYAAQVVEVVPADGGGLRVGRVVAAIDCGRIVNPDGVRAQVEGSVIQGLSAALGEAINISGGRVRQQNYHDYPVLRQAAAPDSIEVHLSASEARPTGAGEPALPAVAPALANAVFAACGRRLRELPLRI